MKPWDSIQFSPTGSARSYFLENNNLMINLLLRAAMAILFLGTMYATTSVARAQEQGNWQRVTSFGGPPNSASTALLQTDGTVMVHQGCTPNWYKLTPNAFGNYVTGTWSQIASMQPTYGPLYYASAVLADGRVVVIGGEFNFCGNVIAPQGAIYDPKDNTWAVLDVPPFMPDPIGGIIDAPSAVLPDGKLLLGFSAFQIAQFDPSTLTFTLVGNSSSKADINNEEGWTLLPDGTVLTVDTRNGTNSEIYIPSSGQWTSAGSTIVPLAAGAEMGPAVLRPEGTVFATGPTGHTAIFRPSDDPSIPGEWSVGPDFPNIPGAGQLAISDGPASLLPDGNVLVAVNPGGNPPIFFFEFDGTNLYQEPSPPNASGDVPFTLRMLLLPTGQVLVTDGSSDVEIYTPSGTFKRAWAPKIVSAPRNIVSGHTYSISGRLFNGWSQASVYGDNVQAATNYPLVRITNHATGHVFFARTHDHSTMGVATGEAMVSTNFDVPSSLEPGPSDLVVVANGIPSSPRVVNAGKDGDDVESNDSP